MTDNHRQTDHPRPDNSRQDSTAYQEKKAFFDRLLTVYGRKPVLECLQDQSLTVYRIHLADSNRQEGIINEIVALAKKRNIEVAYHSRQALSRISKNGKQDQGVAADLICKDYKTAEQFISAPAKPNFELLALDRITNPQNLGMIIRSVCAGFCDGLLLPKKGGAQIESLAIKASAGTAFKAPIIYCEQLDKALSLFREKTRANIYGLSSHARQGLADINNNQPNIFVLGNETDGVSDSVAKQCNQLLAIPMNNGVESLNVAVTASLIAYRRYFAP